MPPCGNVVNRRSIPGDPECAKRVQGGRWPCARKHIKTATCAKRANLDCGESPPNAIVEGMNPLRGAALITGASAGLGHALCHQFAQAKIDVIAVARRSEMLQILCAELTQRYGTENHAICADLSTPQGVQELAERIDREGLEVAYLVNNAGVAQKGRFDQLDPQGELTTISLNVSALVQLCGIFAPRMVERGAGHILNVSSVASFQPGPYMSTYYASKAFVSSFSEALHYELKPQGVLVTTICPGPIQTEMAKNVGMEHTNLFHSVGVFEPEAVAKASFAAMLKGKRKVVIGRRNKLLALSSSLGPTPMVLKVASHLNQDQER